MMASFLVGNSVEITGTFKNINNVLIDPTTVSLSVTSPSGTTTTVNYAAEQITRQSVGLYTYTFIPNVGGTWSYRWVGTGTLPVAAEGSFTIQSSAFVPGS